MIARIKWTVGIGLILGLLAWSVNAVFVWLKAGQMILPLG